MEIKLNNIGKKYEGNVNYTLEGINLSIKSGEFIVLLGPSGCGKTTLLRMIAGLIPITKGDLIFDNRRVNNILPKERDIAMVFQSYALYPTMDVYNNIAFALKMQKVSKSIIHQKVLDVAKVLDITRILYKKPSEISGGQRQRVALGRAIIRKPKIFLMDEPLSNLDAKLRNVMRAEIKRVHRLMGATSIYVTHDQYEAMSLADRIVVLNNNEIQQVGTPDDLYFDPRNLFVAKFIGNLEINRIFGKATKGVFKSDDGKIEFALKNKKLEGEMILAFRPENISLATGKSSNINAEVIDIQKFGNHIEYQAYWNDKDFINISAPRTDVDKIEEGKVCKFNIDEYLLFDRKTEMRIDE